MSSILIKGVPDDLKERLRREAERHRRSLNQQVLLILERATQSIPPVKLPRPVKPRKKVSARMILDGIREGRE